MIHHHHHHDQNNYNNSSSSSSQSSSITQSGAVQFGANRRADSSKVQRSVKRLRGAFDNK